MLFDKAAAAPKNQYPLGPHHEKLGGGSSFSLSDNRNEPIKVYVIFLLHLTK